ncbi:MAG TPA: hypothetical protein VHG34_00940 [Nitrososphaeraceae archaeon]|nr:hypothetical protein [Nitrososphaeraceae archaeon]
MIEGYVHFSTISKKYSGRATCRNCLTEFAIDKPMGRTVVRASMGC